MPQVEVTEHEIEVEEVRLFKRVGELVVSVDEQGIIEKLRAMHLAEYEAYKGNVDAKVLEDATNELKKAAASYANIELRRYLAFGDYLAYEFTKKLKVILDQAKKEGLQKTLNGGGAEVGDLVKASGAYVHHALKTEILKEDGSYNVARILPMVQFRIRWRGLGGVPLDEGISETDRKVHFNFVLSNPLRASVNSRMAAAYQLAQVDESFDRPLAEAIVLNEEGKTVLAIETLDKAVESGEENAAHATFAEYLRENR